MRSRSGEPPLFRVRTLCVVLLFAIYSAIVLSGCSAQPLLNGSKKVADSLDESSKREFVSALLLNVKGEHLQAVERFRQILKREPSNAAVNFALSRSFAGLGISDSASIYSEKSVRLDQSNIYYLQFLAVLSHQMNDYMRAAELYRKLADLDPGRPEHLSLLALEYLSADQPEKALGAFQEILRIDPMNETTQAQVLLLEIKLRHYQDAIGTLSELIEQGDGKEKLRLTLGELYLQTAQYDLAFTTFREILKENPRFVPAWLALFETAVQSGHNRIFLEDLDRFYTVGRISLDQHVDLARLFLVRSSRDTSYSAPALAMIEQLNRHYPGKSGVLLLSGQAKLQRMDAKGAVSDIRKALALAPGDIAIREALVSAYVIRKDFAAAAVTLRNAKKRFPAMTQRLEVLQGELYFQEGKLSKAASLLENVLRLINVKEDKGLYLQATSILALCYDKQGFPDKSIRLYEAILAFDPGNALILNNVAYLLAQQGKELAKAKELAMKAVASEPGSASFLDTLGWVLFKLGEYEKSREYLEKAAGIDQREPEIIDHLSQVYEKLGNPLKAEEMREKSRKIKGK
jgi:tetratricopeptide (TPR) repeat protein